MSNRDYKKINNITVLHLFFNLHCSFNIIVYERQKLGICYIEENNNNGGVNNVAKVKSSKSNSRICI